jgi:hypothetical protein
MKRLIASFAALGLIAGPASAATKTTQPAATTVKAQQKAAKTTAKAQQKAAKKTAKASAKPAAKASGR